MRGTTFPGSDDLEQTGPVRTSGNTARPSGVVGEQIFGLQISKALDATERDAAAAIGCAGSDGVAKIGVASLH